MENNKGNPCITLLMKIYTNIVIILKKTVQKVLQNLKIKLLYDHNNLSEILPLCQWHLYSRVQYLTIDNSQGVGIVYQLMKG